MNCQPWWALTSVAHLRHYDYGLDAWTPGLLLLFIALSNPSK